MNELIELGPLEKILDNMSSLTEHNVRTNLTSTDGKPLTEEEIQEISSYKGKPIRVVFSYHNFHPQPLLIVVVRRIGATEGPTYSKYSLRMIDGEIIPYQDDPANYFKTKIVDFYRRVREDSEKLNTQGYNIELKFS